ncbi:MAG: tetratricopeptide repeat protein [Acidobacteria bacterium]|nr:MAG: tetratricopeptide repeat protein [Acidobacteriota bacterium]
MKGLLLIFFTLSTSLASQVGSLAERAPIKLLTEVQEFMQEGRYDRAEKQLKSASLSDPHVLRLLVELTQREGRRDEAQSYSRRLLSLYQSGQLNTSEDIGQAAYAAWQLSLWQDANRIFIEAAQVQPVSVSLFVDWGNLYLKKYNAAEAELIFRDGIQAMGQPTSEFFRWGVDAAYVGLAQALKGQFRPGATAALAKALDLNPNNLQAYAFNTSLAIEDKNWQEAQEWIEKGLKKNKLFLPLLELECAYEYFRGEVQAFEKLQQRVLKINPNDGDLFETLGDLANRKRLLEEAAEFYREALQRNPRQESARASLGIALLRLGKEEEGKRILEVAYANDPFNIWTVNTLRLLDSFDRFVRFETPHFRMKLHEKEAVALKPYVAELAERSLKTLEQKYNHQVSGKYVFEMYPDHEDFAVRTMGLPGLGALGATFGRIVAMDSPSARPRGEFHWGSTLWHELAHVVTLSLSNGKVPRWFTEGISMMEERQAGEGWGDYLNVGFVQAYKDDLLLPLKDLNSGFERPESGQALTIAYFQAGWICEFLVSGYGFESIAAMLEAFGQGLSTEEVFQQVLGASVEEIDGQFRQKMEETLKPLLSKLEAPEHFSLVHLFPGGVGQEGEGEAGLETDLDTLLQAWQAAPENYFLNLRLGTQLKTAGRQQEAIPYLEKALEILPTQAARGSPYDILTQIYEETGEVDKLVEVRQRWWRAAPLFPENAHRIASLLSDRDQPQEAAKYLEEVMYVDPLQPETHQKLGDLYLQFSETEKAVREYTVFLSLSPVDGAAAHYRLAQALFESGDRQGARNHVLLSLEIAPAYPEAQRLLLKLVRQ